jgi:cytochrome c oxidase subunit 3
MAQSHNATANSASLWRGGSHPYKASYGKLMMWFFLMSDAFTFSTLLVVYGVIRFSSHKIWADPEKVFTHFAGVSEWFGANPPLAFVGLMTFILIASSVTMVLAVEAGHRMDKKAVEKYMILTLIGGAMFLGCQAYEWFHFITGSHHGGLHFYHAIASTVTMPDASVLHDVNLNGTVGQFMADGSVILMNGEHSTGVISADMVSGLMSQDVLKVQGAGLSINEYCQNPSFANLFFFITGFHGTHVASGVVLNFIIFRNVQNGTYHRRGHYEMVEKVGLYWHFVDLVWVFVFTFFYLI